MKNKAEEALDNIDFHGHTAAQWLDKYEDVVIAALSLLAAHEECDWDKLKGDVYRELDIGICAVSKVIDHLKSLGLLVGGE